MWKLTSLSCLMTCTSWCAGAILSVVLKILAAKWKFVRHQMGEMKNIQGTSLQTSLWHYFQIRKCGRYWFNCVQHFIIIKSLFKQRFSTWVEITTYVEDGPWCLIKLYLNSRIWSFWVCFDFEENKMWTSPLMILNDLLIFELIWFMTDINNI